MNFSKSNITKQAAHNGFLAEALLDVRELVPSGSEAMHIIDEALGRVGISPRKVHISCRKCGEIETDPDGLCEICLKCSLCCDEDCGTFDVAGIPYP